VSELILTPQVNQVWVLEFPASVLAGVLWQGAFGWNGFGSAAPFLFGAGLALAAAAIFIYGQTQTV